MNRHFLMSFCISAALPIIGLPLAWVLGHWWEDRYPSSDREVDLENNWDGAVWGQIVGIPIWLVIMGHGGC